MDELTPAQIEALRAALGALRLELEAALERGESGAAVVSLDQPIGRVSRADALQQQAMAKANRRSAELRLRQVTAALSAVDAGEYGGCRRCDEPIGYRRLESRPETPFCVECQRGTER